MNAKNVDEIDTWAQFHQCFYVQIFRTNVVSAAFSSYILALAKNSYEKSRAYNVDEIDGWYT
jgi:hypothetical protein